jgi:hypothetical protein
MDIFSREFAIGFFSACGASVTSAFLGFYIDYTINGSKKGGKALAKALLTSPSFLASAVAVIFISFILTATSSTNIQINSNINDVRTMMEDSDSKLLSYLKEEFQETKTMIDASYTKLNSDESNTNQRLEKMAKMMQTLVESTSLIDRKINTLGNVISDIRYKVDGIADSTDLIKKLVVDLNEKTITKADFESKMANVETLFNINSLFSEKIINLYVDQEYQPRVKEVTDLVLKYLYAESVISVTKNQELKDEAIGYLESALIKNREDKRKSLGIIRVYQGGDNEKILQGYLDRSRNI